MLFMTKNIIIANIQTMLRCFMYSRFLRSEELLFQLGGEVPPICSGTQIFDLTTTTPMRKFTVVNNPERQSQNNMQVLKGTRDLKDYPPP